MLIGRMFRLVPGRLALCLAATLLTQVGTASAQISTDFTTTTTTQTVVEIQVVFSTITQTLPSCPLPAVPLGTGSVSTSTILAVPAAGAVVVQLYFNTSGADGVSYVINRDGDNVVAATNPLPLYIQADGSLVQASDLNEKLYIVPPSGITKRGLVKRFNDEVPVSIGDVPADAIYQGFHEDQDGNIRLKFSTSQGSYMLGFSICPADPANAEGERLNMYDTSLDSPPGNNCLAGLARTRAYSQFASGSTEFPSVPATSASTNAVASSSYHHHVSPQASSTDTDTSVEPQTTPEPNTPTSSALITIPTTTILPSTANTSNSPSTTSAPPTTSTTPEVSPGSSSSSSSSTDSGSTVTIYTTGLTTGSSILSVASQTVATLFLPYPSSVNIMDTANSPNRKVRARAQANTTLDDLSYVGSFLNLGSPSANKSGEYYRLFQLTSDGHLCIPIAGPEIVNGTFTGRNLQVDDYIPQCAYSLPSTSSTYSGNVLKIVNETVGEAAGGKLLKFDQDPKTQYLSLDTSVNVTAGSQIWICNPAATMIGITDGSSAGCNYDKITTLIIWGNQVVKDIAGVYNFITSQLTKTLSLGQGPTAYVQKVIPKVVETATERINDPVGNVAGITTTGLGPNDPTATVMVTQAVKHVNVPNAWQLTGAAKMVTYDPLGPTMVVKNLSPPPKPMFHMSWEAGGTYTNRFIPYVVNGASPPQLMTYGSAAWPTPANYAALMAAIVAAVNALNTANTAVVTAQAALDAATNQVAAKQAIVTQAQADVAAATTALQTAQAAYTATVNAGGDTVAAQAVVDAAQATLNTKNTVLTTAQTDLGNAQTAKVSAQSGVVVATGTAGTAQVDKNAAIAALTAALASTSLMPSARLSFFTTDDVGSLILRKYDVTSNVFAAPLFAYIVTTDGTIVFLPDGAGDGTHVKLLLTTSPLPADPTHRILSAYWTAPYGVYDTYVCDATDATTATLHTVKLLYTSTSVTTGCQVIGGPIADNVVSGAKLYAQYDSNRLWRRSEDPEMVMTESMSLNRTQTFTATLG